MRKIPIIVICGPTASGKTALAIKAANLADGEIVNADSMQIYKYMDIGTAKPTKEELSRAPHHLVGFVNPMESFSVAEYVPLAHSKIADIANRGKIPVLAGGTGLYINSVINDVEFKEEDGDLKLREELLQVAKNEGVKKLMEILLEFDPVSAKRIHPNNVRRVIRAIEFYKTTGKPISEHQEETKQIISRYNPLMLMVDYDREILYDRINRRVDIMFDEGLVDEVKKLIQMGCTRDMQSMQGIGYKEVIEYLDGKMSLDECKELIKQSSRRYAKRQLTWFRRDERIKSVAPGEDIVDIVTKFIKSL